MPAISTYTGLLPLMVADLPACPENVQLQALREAVRQFCLDTEAWIVTLAAIDIEADLSEYTLTPVYDADIRRVMEIHVKTAEDVTNGREGTRIGPDHYHFNQPDNLVLHADVIPRTTVTGGLAVKAALAPYVLSVPGELDWEGFFAVWCMALTYHARMTLLLKPTKPWSNKALGEYFKTLYDRDVGRAKAEIERRYTDMTPNMEA